MAYESDLKINQRRESQEEPNSVLCGEAETQEIMPAERQLARHYEVDIANIYIRQILGGLPHNLSLRETNFKILVVEGDTAGTTPSAAGGEQPPRSGLHRCQQQSSNPSPAE